MRVVGIDPGQSGAYAVFEDGELQFTDELPVIEKVGIDALALNQILFGADLVSLEQVHAVPRDKPHTAFIFGGNFHACRCIAQLNAFRFELVSPQKWKARMLGPLRGLSREEQKKFARQKLIDEHPERAKKCVPPRGRVPKIDRCEAVWIGAYAIEYCADRVY